MPECLPCKTYTTQPLLRSSVLNAQELSGVVRRRRQHLIQYRLVVDPQQVAYQIAALVSVRLVRPLLLHRHRGLVVLGGRLLGVFIAVRVVVLEGGHAVVLLPVAQHAVLEREPPPADVAAERPLSGVRPHVPPQVLRRPEATHAERADHFPVRVVRKPPPQLAVLVLLLVALVGNRRVRVQGVLRHQEFVFRRMVLADVVQRFLALGERLLAEVALEREVGVRELTLASHLNGGQLGVPLALLLRRRGLLVFRAAGLVALRFDVVALGIGRVLAADVLLQIGVGREGAAGTAGALKRALRDVPHHVVRAVVRGRVVVDCRG